MWDGRESSPQTGTQKITYATNSGDLISNLTHQDVDATMIHAQGVTTPSAHQLADIVNFEMSLRTAQAFDFEAGPLNGHGAGGGPAALASQSFFVGINDSFLPSFQFNPTGLPFTPVIFDLYDAWTGSRSGDRARIARGQAVFNSKPIGITGVAGLNDTLGLPSLVGTCGTCHDSSNVGNHSFPVPLNIGVGDLTSPLDVSYLPVITLHNKTTGEVAQTPTPGARS